MARPRYLLVAWVLVMAAAIAGAQADLRFVIPGSSPGDEFGTSVCVVGDLDGDVVAEILVAAPFADLAGIDSGAAFVYSGATGAVLLTLPGDGPGHRFGTTVSGLDDVDLDGVPDFVVGAHHDATNGTNAGMVRIFSGATGLLIREIHGDGPGDFFGIG